MSTNKTDENGRGLLDNQAIEGGSKTTPFYQYFTVYLTAIFLVVVIALSSALLFLSHQSSSYQALITEHLAPLQTQFLQQTYLINANNLIDEIVQNGNAQELITLQHSLSLQSKKLSLLKSQHKNSYQQWFTRNNIATNLIAGIESSHTKNEALKNKVLIQLDTLLDAIKIQLTHSSVSPEQAELLSIVESQLTSTVIMLKNMSLQTPLVSFEQLSDQINSMFVVDYAKQLANSQLDSQDIADIVRDFIRFEDLILKRGLLTKWHGHLSLMHDYQQQLVAQQQQLHSILDSLSGRGQESIPTLNDYDKTNNHALLANQLPLWIFVLFSFMLTCVIGLLWLTRRRIKLANQSATNLISRALDGEKVQLVTTNKVGFLKLQQEAFFSSETEQLINKIQQLKTSNYSEVEYLTLVDKNQSLEEKMVKDNDKQEQLKLELELLEYNGLAKYKSQLLLEQQRCKALHLAAIKQLVLLGSSAVSTTINTSDEAGLSTEDNYLYYAHLQGRDLVRKLRQASCYRYLQSNDAVLTLSDVNLASQVQAILLNLRNKLFLYENSVSVNIEEQILTKVNLDAELFSEMFRVFIRLLFSQHKATNLVLNLQLVDKNNGQQKICFTGQIESKEKIVQLPNTLQAFNDNSIKQSELGDYFITLMQYQHGDDASAKLTDQGYQFTFTLPLAVTSNQQGQQYPVLTIPSQLADIENVCLKLAAKYLAMPIEVLLAVKAPEQYQRLQQLLQAMGLQVTFVTCERMLQKNWQSGRFAVLMTEIDCQPFTTFMIDEGDKSSNSIALDRGVFSLTSASASAITTKPEVYTDWLVGGLGAKSTVAELTAAMQPWIKEQKSDSVRLEKVACSTSQNDIITMDALETFSSGSFNFERYIKHQGSAELAIFMLEEYTAENILLVEQLSHAFTQNDSKQADTVIQALFTNSKILAADNLLQLCQLWRKLLTNQELDSTAKVQITLLNKTKIAVEEICQHADAVA